MITLLKALFAFGALWLIGRTVDWEAALGNLAHLSALSLALVFLVLTVQLLIVSERLRLMIGAVGQKLSYWIAFRATAEGSFFSLTMISLLGSDAARIWRCQRTGVPLVAATSGVLLDRLIGLTANHVMMLAALPWILPRVTDLWVTSAVLFLAAGFTGGILLIYVFGIVKLPARYALRGKWVKLAPLLDIARASRYLFQHKANAVASFVISIGVNVSSAALFYILLIDLGADIGFVDCLILVPIIIQLSLLPISIGGWGIRESAAVIGFGYWGVSSDVALTASILFGILTLIYSLWGGLLWWVDRPRGKVDATPLSVKDAD